MLVVVFRGCLLEFVGVCSGPWNCLELRASKDWQLVLDSDEEQGMQAEEGARTSETVDSQDIVKLDLGPFGDSVMKVRLQQYMELDRLKRCLAGSPPCLMLNLQQNIMYFNQSIYAPSLLQKSHLYDVVAMREVLPIEHLLIQGFPVPSLVKEELARYFPFPGLVQAKHTTSVDKLSCTELRRLAGIGFNWPSAGAMIMLIMMVSGLKFEDEVIESTSKQELYFASQPLRLPSTDE